MQIAIDIAKAIRHMHAQTSPPLMHRDIKVTKRRCRLTSCAGVFERRLSCRAQSPNVLLTATGLAAIRGQMQHVPSSDAHGSPQPARPAAAADASPQPANRSSTTAAPSTTTTSASSTATTAAAPSSPQQPARQSIVAANRAAVSNDALVVDFVAC